MPMPMPTRRPHTAAHPCPAALLMRSLLLWLCLVFGSTGGPELAAHTVGVTLEPGAASIQGPALDRTLGPDLRQRPGDGTPSEHHPTPLHKELEPELELELELDADDGSPPIALGFPRLRALCAGGPRGPPTCLQHGDGTPALRTDRRRSGPRGPPIS